MLFLPSTIGMHEIYFREVTKYLKGKFKDENEDLITETFLPITLEQYQKEGLTLETYTEQLKEYLDKGDEEYMLVSLSNGGNALLDAALECDKVRASVFCDFVGDWEYQDLLFKSATYAFGKIPERYRDRIGGHELIIKAMLAPMFDHTEREKLYQEVVDVTKDHGGEGLINALGNLKKHTSGKKNIEKLRTLSEKKNMDVYSIEASESKDTGKYFDAVGRPEIIRMAVKSKHLIPLQEPEKLGEVLYNLYHDTIQRCDSKEPEEPFPQEQQEHLQILSL